MKVLLIEDEKEIAEFIKKGLEAESWVVDVVHDGEQGAQLALLNPYEVIILDFYLPKMNGLEVAKRIRQSKKLLPIIALTIEPDVDIKVKMLALCDDYVTKPFFLKELIARLKAVQRRGKITPYSDILEAADLRMDVKAYRVTRAGKPIKLRNKEFSLLEYFMRNPGVVLSRSIILENVWDMNTDPFTNTVDVHVQSLRKKIDSKFKNKLIQTIPKRGYIFSR